jgi:hypothetical protein
VHVPPSLFQGNVAETKLPGLCKFVLMIFGRSLCKAKQGSQGTRQEQLPDRFIELPVQVLVEAGGLYD